MRSFNIILLEEDEQIGDESGSTVAFHQADLVLRKNRNLTIPYNIVKNREEPSPLATVAMVAFAKRMIERDPAWE